MKKRNKTLELICKYCNEETKHVLNGKLISEEDKDKFEQYPDLLDLYLVTCYRCKNTYTVDYDVINEKILIQNE